MTTPVIWWTAHDGIDARGPWDTAILEALFANELWDTGLEFTHADRMGAFDLALGERVAVYVVPARHHADADDVAALSCDMQVFDGVVLILCGDEEAIFPWKDIDHPNLRLWVQMPRPGVHDSSAFFFGNGPALMRDALRGVSEPPRKVRDYGFAGQVTHERRKQLVNGLRKAEGRVHGQVHPTAGFGQGLPYTEYVEWTTETKVCPAPSGPCSQDTFRFYEALEAGAIPIADARTPDGRDGYWEMVYGSRFPVQQGTDWSSVGGMIESEVRSWQFRTAQVGAWWRTEKRLMADRLRNDLIGVGAPDVRRQSVTAIITTSPIPSHPSTKILEETLESIYAQIGKIPVVIACDGIREEQRAFEARYHEYLRQIVWKSHHVWSNVQVVISHTHRHQAGTTELALREVDTPLLLFMEHDTPFSEEPIDWEACIEMMLYRGADVLRFHHEAQVHPEHTHLMRDHETVNILGVPVRRTTQWSQRPHLADANYYRKMLATYFKPGANTMIEDRMHGVAQDRPAMHRIAIYHPEGTIRRSLHTDGRGDQPKFPMKFA